MSPKHFPILAVIMFAAVPLSFSEPVLTSSGGGGLSWESPLEQIQQSITGPVAGFIALAGSCDRWCDADLRWGTQRFCPSPCYVAMAGGVLLGATQIVALFGATGASIGEHNAGAGAAPAVSAPETTPSAVREGARG